VKRLFKATAEGESYQQELTSSIETIQAAIEKLMREVKASNIARNQEVMKQILEG
jgi:hypothetical protein